MAHTYCSSLFHCVFSTKGRRKIITPKVQDDLLAYMGGIARKQQMKALAAGGMDDHVHLLLSLPSSMSVAKAMQEIKRGSSLWMHESYKLPSFEWQEGYGAFSIGWAQVRPPLPILPGRKNILGNEIFKVNFYTVFTNTVSG
jgi:putative transposase